MSEQAGVATVGGVCRFCGCTDVDMGRDDSGQEAGWATMQRDVCTKPQCLTQLRKATRRADREVEMTRREATRPIRRQINQAAKRKRERRERAAAQKRGRQ